MSPPNQVLVVAHDPGTRSALVEALGGGFAPCGAATADDAKAALEGKTALVVVDGLRDTDAMDFLLEVTGKDRLVPIVAVLGEGDDARVVAAIRAGARGCLYLADARTRLASAVREVIDGGCPTSPGMASLFLEHIRSTSRRSSAVRAGARPLTARERIVLDHMSRGLSYEDTGTALGVSVNTVRTYVRAIYEKLDVSSRTEAVLTGIELGVIPGTSGG